MKRRTVKKRDKMDIRRLLRIARKIRVAALKMDRAIYLMRLRIKQHRFPPGGIVSPAKVDGSEYIVSRDVILKAEAIDLASKYPSIPFQPLTQHEHRTNQRRGI